MPGSVEQLRARAVRLAGQLARDPRFDRALGQYCTGTSTWFRRDLRLIGVLGDRGQMATVAAGFALQGSDGVTLARIIETVAGAGFASPRRVRAICDNLRRLDTVWVAGDRRTGRDKPLRFGDWLEAALVELLETVLRAANPWFDRPADVDGVLLARVLASRIDLLKLQSNRLSPSSPEDFFLEHVAGYPMVLELIAAPLASRAVSRKGLARVYGVSRPHVANLIAHAEDRGWIRTHGERRAISLAPATSARLRRWVAHELAIVICAVETSVPP